MINVNDFYLIIFIALHGSENHKAQTHFIIALNFPVGGREESERFVFRSSRLQAFFSPKI